MRICTMKEYDLNQLINNKEIIEEKIGEFSKYILKLINN